MFNNLIESSSHRKEFKRRGSFFLVTTASYALMLVLTGIASIYAYDARLQEQHSEQVVTMLPPEPAPAPTKVIADPARPRDHANNKSNIPERAVAMLDVNRPEVPPATVSAEPNKVQPLPPGPVKITGRDWNPPLASGGGNNPSGTGGGTRIAPPTRVILDDDLPPLPPAPPANKIIRSGKVLNSQAIYLPKPLYPPMARQIRLQGQVNVQVLIDEG